MNKYLKLKKHADYLLNEPGRLYHNCQHTAEVIEACRTLLGNPLALPLPLLLAARWHDVIYIPGATSNEESSANHLLWCLTINNHERDNDEYAQAYEQARNLILDTKVSNHLTDIIRSTDPLSNVLMDADLVSLSTQVYESFKLKQFDIIEEFGFIINPETKSDTAKFLNKFLERPFIYRTDYAREHWEDTAILNIQRFSNDFLIS
jgi:predicted metal-dependent HD superfamily phosphohydrolase